MDAPIYDYFISFKRVLVRLDDMDPLRTKAIEQLCFPLARNVNRGRFKFGQQRLIDKKVTKATNLGKIPQLFCKKATNV